MVATHNGGYALVGSTGMIINGSFTPSAWLVKTDSNGVMEWNKTYTAKGSDTAGSLVATSDGGYAFGGSTRPPSSIFNSSYWLVKTDSKGVVEWNRTYGEAIGNALGALAATPDGGYLMVGTTSLNDTGTLSTAVWLIKTHALGNVQWDKKYTGFSSVGSLVLTPDAGYAMAGLISTEGYESDICLVKTDSAGNIEWNKTYVGAGNDLVHSLVRAPDGGYVLAGTLNIVMPFSAESSDSEVVETGTFESVEERADGTKGDVWLIKTNSSGAMLWNRTYGGAWNDEASSLIAMSDGGYAMAGSTDSSWYATDLWLIKTDASGNTQWNQTFGGAKVDRGVDLLETSDGGYVIRG